MTRRKRHRTERGEPVPPDSQDQPAIQVSQRGTIHVMLKPQTLRKVARWLLLLASLLGGGEMLRRLL